MAEVFVSFCLEGCFLEQGGNFADRRSSEMAGWLGRFKRGLTPKSIACVNRVAREWDAGTRDRWYRVSGYRPSWISSRLSDMKKRREEKRLQKTQEKLRGRYSPRKKRRGRMLVPVLVLSALGLVGWLVYPQLVRSVVYPHREPVEQGKRLGVWLDQYRKSMLAVQESDRDVPRKDAEGAIRKIGTNALPALLRMVQAKDSAAGTRVVRVLGLRSEDDYHTRSTDGFAVLGAGAKPAVGALVRALGDKSSGIRACAATCLGSIGPEAKDAVPALRQLFGDRVITVRTAATNAIAQVDVGAGAGAGGGEPRNTCHPGRWTLGTMWAWCARTPGVASTSSSTSSTSGPVCATGVRWR